MTLFAQLLMRRLAVDPLSAWLSAGLLGSSYAIWRYATEVEVYATAALLSTALLHVAFALDEGTPRRLAGRVVAVACLGGLATLAYQSIGFLAGIAIPLFLLLRLGFRPAALYCASGWRSALATAALADMGFEAAHVAGGFTAWVEAGGAVDGKPPESS